MRIKIGEECLFDLDQLSNLSVSTTRVVPISKIDNNTYKVVSLDNKDIFNCPKFLLFPYKKRKENIVYRNLSGQLDFTTDDLKVFQVIKNGFELIQKSIIESGLEEAIPTTKELNEAIDEIKNRISPVEAKLQAYMQSKIILETLNKVSETKNDERIVVNNQRYTDFVEFFKDLMEDSREYYKGLTEELKSEENKDTFVQYVFTEVLTKTLGQTIDRDKIFNPCSETKFENILNKCIIEGGCLNGPVLNVYDSDDIESLNRIAVIIIYKYSDNSMGLYKINFLELFDEEYRKEIGEKILNSADKNYKLEVFVLDGNKFFKEDDE